MGLIAMSVADTARKVSYIHDQIADLHALTRTTHDIINPSPVDTHDNTPTADLSDEEPAIEMPDSHVQNMEMADRVAMLKEQIANTTKIVQNLHKPTSITPLHPDVYNIPSTDEYVSPNTIEYVK